MPWLIKHTEEVWTGDTHVLAGNTFTGKTRTPASRPLVFVAELPKPKTTPSSKPKRTRAKAAPKPKGATAWD